MCSLQHAIWLIYLISHLFSRSGPDYCSCSCYIVSCCCLFACCGNFWCFSMGFLLLALWCIAAFCHCTYIFTHLVLIFTPFVVCIYYIWPFFVHTVCIFNLWIGTKYQYLVPKAMFWWYLHLFQMHNGPGHYSAHLPYAYFLGLALQPLYSSSPWYVIILYVQD